jgi:hypothetical protein
MASATKADGPDARGVTAARARRGLIVLAAIALLTLCGAPQALAAGPQTGLVRGVVVLGPFLPVSRGSSPAWPPTKAVVKIFRHGLDRPYRTLRTDADGLFSARLPAGAYRLTPEPIGVTTLPIPHSTVTRVAAGKTRRVRLWLDTGVQFPEAKDAGQTVVPAEPPEGEHAYRQGVLGTTRRGPIVPSVRPGEPGDAPCDATLAFSRRDGRLVARVPSTKQDGFLVALPAGVCIVDAQSAESTFDLAGPFTLRIPKRQWLSLAVLFDTGIRFVGRETSAGVREATLVRSR